MIYEFSPRQDYNGYDKPWAPGTGKNKLPDRVKTTSFVGCTYTETNGKITISGTATGNGGRSSFSTPYLTLPSGTYYAQIFNKEGTPRAQAFIRQGKRIISSFSDTIMFTLEEEATDINIGFNVLMGESYNYSAYIGIFTENMSAYSPYANICPPIGYNIYDPETGSPIEVYAGYVNDVTRELFLRPVYEEYAGETLVGPWMSSMDEYTEGGTPTEGAFVVDLGGELTRYEITDFQMQSLLSSLGIRLFFKNGASLLNSLMDQAQGRVRSQYGLHVHAIGPALPAGLTFKPISHDILPAFPGKIIKQEEKENADG